MADIFFLLFYMGGATAYSDNHSFWRSIVWPYFLARQIVRALGKDVDK